jgi:serine/threonine-protein kinase HipA
VAVPVPPAIHRQSVTPLGSRPTSDDTSAIGVSAPDRWGRVLVQRMERCRARHDRKPRATLREIDYLLGVDDETRAGTLRFAEREGGSFLRPSDAKRVPPLLEGS